MALLGLTRRKRAKKTLDALHQRDCDRAAKVRRALAKAVVPPAAAPTSPASVPPPTSYLARLHGGPADGREMGLSQRMPLIMVGATARASIFSAETAPLTPSFPEPHEYRLASQEIRIVPNNATGNIYFLDQAALTSGTQITLNYEWTTDAWTTTDGTTQISGAAANNAWWGTAPRRQQWLADSVVDWQTGNMRFENDMIFFGSSSPPPLSAEQREHIRRRHLAADKRRRQARRRGRKLLLAMLTEEQMRDYAKTGTFVVTAGDGRRFRLAKGRRPQELAPDGLPWKAYCIHPSGGFIDEDTLLAQKLMLETDPERFQQVANISLVRSLPEALRVAGEQNYLRAQFGDEYDVPIGDIALAA